MATVKQYGEVINSDCVKGGHGMLFSLLAVSVTHQSAVRHGRKKSYLLLHMYTTHYAPILQSATFDQNCVYYTRDITVLHAVYLFAEVASCIFICIREEMQHAVLYVIIF